MSVAEQTHRRLEREKNGQSNQTLLRPADQFLVNRPCQRRTNRLPPHPQSQPIKQTPRALLLDHSLGRNNHILVPTRIKLQPSLNRIEGIRERSRGNRGDKPRREIDTGGDTDRVRRQLRHALSQSRRDNKRCMQQSRQLRFRLLVEQHVQSGIRRVPHSGSAKASKEPAEALGAGNVARGGGEGGVGVEGGLVADFEDGDGGHDEACACAGEGSRREVGCVA